jgi:hypothetical protein
MSDAELAVEIRAAAEQIEAACATAVKAGVPVDLAVTAADDLSSAYAVHAAASMHNSPPNTVRAAVERMNADLAEAAGRKIRVRLVTPTSGQLVVQEMWRAG